MITTYFGVPGCGKTTFAVRDAQKELKRISRGKSYYNHVLTNFYCDGCEQIQLDWLACKKARYSKMFFDEATIDADSRSFKSFPKGLVHNLVMHRHVHCDMSFYTQDFSRLDKTIRNLTYDLWYVTKPVVPFFNKFSIARRIFRNVTINEFTSELIMGYRFSKFLERIFCPTMRIIYRPRWYKYFDSYEEGVLGNRDEINYVSWKDALPDPEVL